MHELKDKKQSYSDKLKSPQWQRKRLEIFSRDNWACVKCGDTETTLHVHHKEYINGNDPWDYDSCVFATLCEHCHQQIEILKKRYSSCEIDNISICKHKSLSGDLYMWGSMPGMFFQSENMDTTIFLIETEGSIEKVKNLIRILGKSITDGTTD